MHTDEVVCMGRLTQIISPSKYFNQLLAVKPIPPNYLTHKPTVKNHIACPNPLSPHINIQIFLLLTANQVPPDSLSQWLIVKIIWPYLLPAIGQTNDSIFLYINAHK